MFAGSAGAVTTFTEDFETAGPFGGGTGGAFGTYTTGQNFSADPHSNVTGGGAAYGHLIGVANPASSDAVEINNADLPGIIAGNGVYNFSGWLASYTADPEASQFSVQFYSDDFGLTPTGSAIILANGKVITGSSDANTPGGTWNDKNWSLYTSTGAVPTDAQSFIVTYSSVTTAGGALGGNDAYADNISLSVSVVPEPSSLALLGLGGLSLLSRRKR